MNLTDWERHNAIKFKYPFPKAVEGFKKVLNREYENNEYDPTNLFVWGQMMAIAVLGMMKEVEREFGQQGQEVCAQALKEVGRKIGEESFAGVDIPSYLNFAQKASIFATWVNEVIYASLEDPQVDSEDKASFHISWCPHQDVYTALDCRVQRYLVEGMLEAAAIRMGLEELNVRFDCTIPSGAETCHFTLWRREEGEGNAWKEYSSYVSKRALGHCQA